MASCLGGLDKLVNTLWPFCSLSFPFSSRIQTKKGGLGVSFPYFIGSLLLLGLYSKEFLSVLLFRKSKQLGQAMTAL